MNKMIMKKTIIIIGIILIIATDTITTTITTTTVNTTEHDESLLNLPKSHLPFYLNNFPNAISYYCGGNIKCEQKFELYLSQNEIDQFDNEKCWGYEPNCEIKNSYGIPYCPGDHTGWVINKQAQIDTFYVQGDFGYIRQRLQEMMVMCEPIFPGDSVLECAKNLRFCRGRNLLVNFTNIQIKNQPNFRYKMDVLSVGHIGGYCKLYDERLANEMEHMSALQSWAPELRNFQQRNERPIEANDCDEIIIRPTIFMKIDASINMYHHFCDFLNLYASLHMNASHPAVFSTDVNILVWETYRYESPFSEIFKIFTRHPIMNLNSFAGKSICFKNLVMPLLPRMIFGLYYNTPIVYGCQGSGLVESFSEHVLHRMNIPLHRKRDDRLRITILSRKTKFRNINNIEELVDAVRANESYLVNLVSFERSMPFRKQLEITRNTDIFIGIHGAGLTHLLFLPKWATLFELYNCEDKSCYRDLARLRGINYITWENTDKLIQDEQGTHPDGYSHAKFTNYSFDHIEFMKLVNKAADNVYRHEEFQKFIQKNKNKNDDDDNWQMFHNEL